MNPKPTDINKNPQESPDKSPFNIEAQNIARTLTKKNTEISFLKRQLTEKLQFIAALQSELFALKKFYSDSSKLKQELDRLKEKNEQQDKEIKNLNQKIIDQHKKFSEEKRIQENEHMNEIARLKGTIDSYIQKTLRSNMNEIDNEKLNIQLNQLKKENEDIILKTKQDMIKKEIQNKIKFDKLKNRMLENINDTKKEVTELNMKYMDVSTKLTLLQNHQLLVQLDYQTQQLEESTKKNELLEKKIFDLTRDLEVHKEVEIAFAEKNKKLKTELLKYKKEDNKSDIKLSEENGSNNKSSGDINAQQSSKLSQMSNQNSPYINKMNNNDYLRIINLEKKVINLEKKLELKKKEYNELRDKSELFENTFKNQEKKYSGLYHFLEESLNTFFSDEYILNNKEIFISKESLQKFDFNNLTKHEKYSTLVVLMKYLMPLVYGENDFLSLNSSKIDKYSMNYHFPDSKLIFNDRFQKISYRKIFRNISSDNINKRSINRRKNSYESLPSIIRGVSLRKPTTKIPTTASAISSTTVNLSAKN